MRVLLKESLTAAERGLLVELLELSFDCRMESVSFLDELVLVVWVEHTDLGLCGAAAVEAQAGSHYLSKFAVAPSVRGDGVAKLMWDALCAEQDAVCWRGRVSNPFGAWYRRRSDGSVEGEGWSVFWHGLHEAEVERAVGYAVARPADFVS